MKAGKRTRAWAIQVVRHVALEGGEPFDRMRKVGRVRYMGAVGVVLTYGDPRTWPAGEWPL